MPATVRSTSDDLVGLAEIAALLNVSRQKADELSATSGFPLSLLTMSGRRVWERAEVKVWAQEHQPTGAGAEADVAGRVRFADRNFPVRDSDVFVPTSAVEGPNSEPDLAWIRSEPSVVDGSGYGGLPIKIVPMTLWSEHIDHLGGNK